MRVLLSLIAVAVLLGIGWFGGRHMPVLFGAALPYAAAALFLCGFIYKVTDWARSAVPFRIPTTSGQQKSLPWIKSSYLDNPHDLPGVLGRMFLEVVFFRSLFRNTQSELRGGPRLSYAESKWLWAASLAFHWTFAVILLRHFRFFMEPVPAPVHLLAYFDGLFEIGVPVLYASDVVFLGAVTFLFLRRVFLPHIRYISLAADYFPLFLILAIGGTGVLMRYFTKVDLIAVKELVLGLTSFSPAVPDGIGPIFFAHLFLVCVLAAYFPFSKLMHLGGVFLSPTRNLANNNRMRRHINPWNYKVKTHTYQEYEDEFRDVMKEAGLPLEREK